MSKQKHTTIETGETALIEVPVGSFDPRAHYAKTHVNMRLTPSEAVMLEKIRLGLMDRNERLEDGRTVQYSADVVRWMLSNMTAA